MQLIGSFILYLDLMCVIENTEFKFWQVNSIYQCNLFEHNLIRVIIYICYKTGCRNVQHYANNMISLLCLAGAYLSRLVVCIQVRRQPICCDYMARLMVHIDRYVVSQTTRRCHGSNANSFGLCRKWYVMGVSHTIDLYTWYCRTN